MLLKDGSDSGTIRSVMLFNLTVISLYDRGRISSSQESVSCPKKYALSASSSEFSRKKDRVGVGANSVISDEPSFRRPLSWDSASRRNIDGFLFVLAQRHALWRYLHATAITTTVRMAIRKTTATIRRSVSRRFLGVGGVRIPPWSEEGDEWTVSGPPNVSFGPCCPGFLGDKFGSGFLG